MKSKVYEVGFQNKSYPNDGFEYWIAASCVTVAIKKAQSLYKRDALHNEGAKVEKVKFIGTLDA
jgi:hypothetical protein